MPPCPRSRLPLFRPVLLSVALLLSGCPDKVDQAASAPGTPPTAASAPRPPAELFADNCRACHGPKAMFAPVLVNARSKPDETVAMWIYNAQKVKPGTAMPDFSEVMSTQEALGLARWIKAGNPVAPAPEP